MVRSLFKNLELCTIYGVILEIWYFICIFEIKRLCACCSLVCKTVGSVIVKYKTILCEFDLRGFQFQSYKWFVGRFFSQLQAFFLYLLLTSLCRGSKFMTRYNVYDIRIGCVMILRGSIVPRRNNGNCPGVIVLGGNSPGGNGRLGRIYCSGHLCLGLVLKSVSNSIFRIEQKLLAL